MKYKDRIYGEFEITEPVILDLINSPSLKRLKEIDQAGYFEAHYPGTAHSRFEHSVGVYLLLKMYGAPLSEQIAGLIHDVSHSAFSHCVDYALDAGSEEEQSHQDNVFAGFVKKSDIPGILRNHDINLDFILDDSNFTLLERDLPELCADRIDYSLRGAVIFKEITGVKYFLDNLRAENGEWAFKSFQSAKKFAELFLKMSSVYYAGLASAVMFRTVGDYLRRALHKKYITEADLYTTDREVLRRIRPFHSSDAELKMLFDRMNKKVGCENCPDDFNAKVTLKSRAVDPLFRRGDKILRVSEADPSWGGIVKRELEPKKYFLKFKK
ncbi:MAG: HD domain-containing protein [Patescibacteria group bacterium]|jgi:hypothetical protein